jgi:hypothetical protein
MIETALNVAFYDPWIRHPVPPRVLVAFMRQGSSSDILQGAMRAPSGSKPVGDMPKLRLEDWLQKCLDRALNDAILDRGHTPSELHLNPTNLWDRLRSSTRSIRCADSGLSF